MLAHADPAQLKDPALQAMVEDLRARTARVWAARRAAHAAKLRAERQQPIKPKRARKDG